MGDSIALPFSCRQDWPPHGTHASRGSSTELPSESAGPALLSTVVGEGQGQNISSHNLRVSSPDLSQVAGGWGCGITAAPMADKCGQLSQALTLGAG